MIGLGVGLPILKLDVQQGDLGAHQVEKVELAGLEQPGFKINLGAFSLLKSTISNLNNYFIFSAANFYSPFLRQSEIWGGLTSV